MKFLQMNRTLLVIKHRILSTSVGKKFRRIRYRAGFTRKNALRALSGFCIPPTEELLSDMLKEAKEHDVTFPEYLMYHFYELDEKARREFIPIWEAASKYIEVFDDYRTADLFYDKEKVYNKFKQFYGRRLIALHKYNNTEKEEFLAFFRSAGRVIVKPVDGEMGRGVRIFNNGKEAEKIFEQLKHDYRHGAVVEEVVEQDERTASLHPASLNTLRIATFRYDDEIIVLPPVMRVGTNGNVVDNGGSGGILCQLDEKGRIISTRDEKGRTYEYHPTTNKRLIEFQMPDVANAIEFAKQLSSVYPEVPYVGWDIALSKDGFVMIEGNTLTGFTAWQSSGKGSRPLVDYLLSRYKKEKSK